MADLSDGGFVVPAEFRLAAHARTRGNGERTGLEIADQYASLLKLDLRGRFDVAFELARDRDFLRAHAAVQFRIFLDREIALHVDVALELAGDAHVTGAFDLAFDRDVG